jgi:hypothetical protein
MQLKRSSYSPVRSLLTTLVVLALIIGLISKYRVMVLVLSVSVVASVECIRGAYSFGKGLLVRMIRGVQCPACQRWALARVAVISFGPRFYECVHCGRRCKQFSAEEPWLDASSKEDDEIYRPTALSASVRKRQTLRYAWKSLAPIAAPFVLGSLGWLIAGERGGVAGAALGLYVFFGGIATTKATGESRHALWDAQVDG